jgi:hypothetical protein
MNDYILDFNTRSNTDWVLTFPGKHEFIDQNDGTAFPPYTAQLLTTGACEPVAFTFFDRDEQSATPPPGGFSPVTPQPGSSVCWESTVVSIRNGQAHTSASDTSSGVRSGVLGSMNARAVTINTSPAFQAGWINMNFTGTNALIGIVSRWCAPVLRVLGPRRRCRLRHAHTVHGPAGDRLHGQLARERGGGLHAAGWGTGNCSGNYMTLFNHSYRTTITP